MNEIDPGMHRYLVVHRALPALLFANPEQCIANLTQAGLHFVGAIWDNIAGDMPPELRVSAEGLLIERREKDGTVFIYISWPLPQAATEAYFTAVVYRPGKQGLFKRQPALARYITLEHAIGADGAAHTMLCEWTQDQLHRNYGEGPEPLLELFAERVQQLTAQG